MLKYLLLLFFAVNSAFAVSVKELSIEYQRLNMKSRMAEMYPYHPKEGIALNMNLGLLGPIHWDNRIHATTDSGQYRLIGWEFFLGVTPCKWFDIGYLHHSQHLLGAVEGKMGFPVEDSLFMKFYIVR